MKTVADKVREETKRFEAALPALMKTHEGKWVVFRAGEVCTVHDSELAAYTSGLEQFGPNGGFVIACVAGVEPIPLTAAVMFGA